MRKPYAACRAMYLVLAFGCWAIAQDSDEQISLERGILVRVCDHANVPSKTLSKAEDEARRIFRHAGVGVEWRNSTSSRPGSTQGNSCHRQARPGELVVTIFPSSSNGTGSPDRTTYGYALVPAVGGLGQQAAVFYQGARVARTSRPFGDASEYQVLGHQMAHELGHLLLGTRFHSPAGIMRGEWAQKDWNRAARGDLQFTPEQAAHLRASVLTRTQPDQIALALTRSSDR